MNILIADDNPTNLKLLRLMLEAEGYSVFETVDGIDALQVLEREEVGAVISDILMPRMDGYRLCHEVRRNERLRDMPFIFYTSTYLSPSDEKLGLELGADKFLRKPASARDLVASLQAATSPSVVHAHPPSALSNMEVLQEYSERLVTKLEQKNIELEFAHQELRQLLAHSPAVTYRHNFEGQEIKPLIASANIERMLGFTVAESSDSEWWMKSLHEEDRERVLTVVTDGLARDGYSVEYRIRHKDGSYRWVEDNNRVVRDEFAEPKQSVGVWTDITDRKNAERFAFRSQRLEAIGTLAGGIAHDLNNVLAPIMMGAEMLRIQYPDQSELVDILHTSAKRGADMVRHLLTFAKGAEGERVSIDPRRFIKELESMMKGSFPKNIQIMVACDAKLPTVLGDATQLHQILLNLCVNARDAMNRGGTLKMEAHHIVVSADYAKSIPDATPGSYVVLSVSDTGTGIPPEILDRIFDPFFSTKGPDKGTGLGLSTVLGIVKGHGGFLHVSSQPGMGSTFTVYLPVDGAESAPLAFIGGEGECRGHGETILFVDDELALREIGRAVLRRLNFNPLTATDGADALMQAAEHRTELRGIITDLQMPRMDGLEFVRGLRRILPDIPVVITSGLMEEQLDEEFRRLGVTCRLSKPFSEIQLGEALKNVFAIESNNRFKAPALGVA